MEYRTSDALCGVYRIVNNINGKMYVGQSINIKARWKDHINTLNRNDSHSVLLQRAWNKYGQENFSFEILELCTEDMLDEVESKYIIFYNTIQNGYNIESGGNKNKHLSEETRKKIGDSHRGKHMSEESRQKMSSSRTGEGNGMFGKHHTEDARRKMSAAKTGKPGHPCTEYQKKCARLANLGKTVSEETKRKISEAAKGRPAYNKNPRPVYCIELERVFDTASDAGKNLNISSSNIIGCCEHIRKTCGGYQWIYADTDEYFDFINSYNTKLII